MNYLHRVNYILKHPHLFLMRPKRLFMLSHMRSRSSLLSHILGSNEDIAGYSELSINYKEKFSLVDQNIALHEDGLKIDSKKILFDKILHNSYDFKNPSKLNRDEFMVIIMIRPPVATIKSIVTMGEKNGNAKYGNVDWACRYYAERLTALLSFSKKIKSYVFINSDDLVNSPDKTLARLSALLELKSSLSREYLSFNKTGMKKFGDTSQNIKKGKIVTTQENNYINIPEALSDKLVKRYLASLDALSAGSL